MLLALGLLRGKYWAWLTVLALEIIRILTTVITLPRGPLWDVIQVLISLTIIVYLLQPHARASSSGSCHRHPRINRRLKCQLFD